MLGLEGDEMVRGGSLVDWGGGGCGSWSGMDWVVGSGVRVVGGVEGVGAGVRHVCCSLEVAK